MVKQAYIPLGIERARYVYASHLPGVRAKVAGFTVGEVRVSKLTWRECRLIEKSVFMDDLQDVFAYQREPYFVVFTSYFDDEVGSETFRIRARRSIGLLLRALRLSMSGEFWDPLEFVLYERNGSLNQRDPRVFGRLAFQCQPVVTLTKRDIAHLDGIYAALDLFDRCRVDAALDRAEVLFAASYSPAHGSYAHRLLPLMAAVEILADRHVAALRDAQWADDAVRAWADAHRINRNLLAHSLTVDARIGAKTVTTTRRIVRTLLREAIAWRLLEPERPDVTGADLVQRTLAADAADLKRLAQLCAEYKGMG